MKTRNVNTGSAGNDCAAAGSRHAKSIALSTVSALSLMLSIPAHAQTAAPVAVDEIVVTGSRIVRDGYEAPTPMTVLDSAVFQQQATSNIADALVQIPAFAGNIRPGNTGTSVSAQGAGLSILNLRSMGAARTLVLIDGQRTVSSRADGVVDVANIPQALVQRVDMITGGASAIYGSDAVTGVVNFILDKSFTGVKGEVSAGLTTYGDDFSYKTVLTAGVPFANGRGHWLINGEINNKEGILHSDRPWNRSALGIINNSAANIAAGQPQRLVRIHTDSWSTRGGTIASGPLKGIAFGPGGTPYMFNFGPITDSTYTYEGDYAAGVTRVDTYSLDPRERRKGLFTRVSYDLTDTVEVFAQASWNNSWNTGGAFSHFQLGNGATVRTGNPFIPASVQAQMTALGVTQFQLGSMNYDLPFITTESDRTTNRYVLGANGDFDAFSSSWNWNAYWQKGITRVAYDALGPTRNPLRAQAADAVRHPTTGAIICRSTLTNPNDGCVPYNPMGLGVNSDAAIRFLQSGGEHPHTNHRITQDVAAGSVSGDMFDNWAGPVSLALSTEYRVEKAVARPSAATLTSDWFSGNFLPFSGKYTVFEGAAETVVPLAKEASFAEAWDLSAAVRGTKYSTSGFVTTWKFGTTYEPIPDIRIRATRSRDIRAPNLQELYNPVSGGFTTLFDPVTGGSASPLQTNSGNPNLKPERADTTDVGVVLKPEFFPGFTASVDYWNISMKDSISTPSNNQIVVFCVQGLQSYCADITRTNGIITAITRRPVNIAVQKTRGIDFEASYNFALGDVISAWDGNVDLRAQVTKYIKNYIDTTLAPPTDDVGEMPGGAPPNWAGVVRLAYRADTWQTSLSGRAMSSGVLRNTYIECQSGCTVGVAPFLTVDNNHAPGYFYLDWSVGKTFDIAGAEVETFLNINNLLNTDPGMIPRGSDEIGYELPTTNIGKYDTLGRVFRAGVRFRM
ncbi:MAG: TonB-dependent receptor [Rhodospirillaceae bacterium]|nr:TonB-dependent receptor [Rhodospirillaceae bacterium]